MSPEREQANLELNIRLMEQEEDKWATGWYAKRYDEVNNNQALFDKTLSSLIQFDLTRAEKVVGNMASLTKEEEDFDFFCSLFENNFSSIDSRSKKEILRWVTKYVQEKQTEAFTADVDDTGDDD